MIEGATAQVGQCVRTQRPFHPQLFPLPVVHLEMDDKTADRTASVIPQLPLQLEGVGGVTGY